MSVGAWLISTVVVLSVFLAGWLTGQRMGARKMFEDLNRGAEKVKETDAMSRIVSAAIDDLEARIGEQ